MLSALFLARTFDDKNLKINDKFIVPIFMDEENYFLEIKYLQKDTLNTDFGNVECLVFKPLMQEGRVFENGEKMKIWISNDKNRLLLKVETQIWAGKIVAMLIDYTNIKYSLKCSAISPDFAGRKKIGESKFNLILLGNFSGVCTSPHPSVAINFMFLGKNGTGALSWDTSPLAINPPLLHVMIFS